MKRLTVIIVACFFAGIVLASPGKKPKASTYLKVTVEVKRTKADGKPWDIGRGAPDIRMQIYHEDLGKLTSRTMRNTYKCSYKFNLGDFEGRSVRLEIWDIDIADHDYIGGCTIPTSGGSSGTCGRATVSTIATIGE